MWTHPRTGELISGHTFDPEDVTAFEQGFAEAVLWANTTGQQDGEDVTDVEPAWWQTPAADWAVDAFDAEGRAEIRSECGSFLTLTETMLRAATMCDPRRDMSHHGHDFALTRNGHGAGFWDRGYPDRLGRALTDAAKSFGSADAWFTDDEPVIYGNA